MMVMAIWLIDDYVEEFLSIYRREIIKESQNCGACIPKAQTRNKLVGIVHNPGDSTQRFR